MNKVVALMCLFFKVILGTGSPENHTNVLLMIFAWRHLLHSNVAAVKISEELLLRFLFPDLAYKHWNKNSSYGLCSMCYLSKAHTSVKYAHDISFGRGRK